MNVATATGLTAQLAERSATLDFAELPADVVELAEQAVIDWFGVTLGGCHEDGPSMLLEVLARGDPADRRTVTVVGHATRLPARDAALVNGTSSHRLDYDDVNLSLPGHVSVAVLGAVLALAEQHDASGAELITSFLAGYETACRVAAAVGSRPYLQGFHATGTIGTFGAAAGCARLLRLDAGRTSVALGIAASQAAGLKCNLGTMTKSLHAGKACENGLLAAELAARGFTASREAIEGEQGFAAISGGDCDLAAALAEPPLGWYLRGNLFKHHAACYFTHSAIEGIGELRTAYRLDGERVRRIVLHVGELELGACAIAEPATALEVKFSIAHLAAMALLGRDTTVIADADAADAEVLELRRRVVLEPDGAPGQPTRVEIELDDETIVRAASDVNTPEPDPAARRGRLERKFLTLAEPVLGDNATTRLLSLLNGLERTDVRALMAAAQG